MKSIKTAFRTMQKRRVSQAAISMFLLLFAALWSQAQPNDSIPAAWKARWIAPPNISLKQYGVFLFRKEISLPGKPARFLVHLSGDNRYRLFANGKPVVFGPQRSDVAHWRYETVDLAPFLDAGKNTLAAWVWNQGEQVAWAQFSHQTGLLVQGHSEAEAMANTDVSWKVAENHAYTPLANTAHILGPFDQVYTQRYPWGWELPGFNDKNWVSAIETEPAMPAGGNAANPRHLLPRSIPVLDEMPQRFATVRAITGTEADPEPLLAGTGTLAIAPWSTVTMLLDQGVLTTAFPELSLSGGRGATLTFTYAEALTDRKTGQKDNRNEVEGKQMEGSQDVFLPDGEARRTFRPLWYRSFRYVELKIENHQEPLTIHTLASSYSAYPFRENAVFRSSDSSLTLIWDVGWRTARLCAYETYMDCPSFEQLQYVGDTRIQALVSLYVSGDDRLMRNALEQFNDSRFAEGLTLSRYPSNLRQVIPPFSLFWIGMVHDYWMHRRDDAFVKSFAPGIEAVLQWHEKYLNEQDMLGKMPHWNFVDWPSQWPWKGYDEVSGVPAGALEGNSSILTLQYVYILQKAADLYRAWGQPQKARHYADLARRLGKGTYRHCWDATRKLMADTPDKKEFSQHANAMAVLSGAVPAADAPSLLRRITGDTSLIQCTFYYRFYLAEALKKAGLADDYLPMLEPWHNMIGLGLTTFAERPEPTRSDCHAWSASPNYHLLSLVAGITPASPGFKTVRIRPALGSLARLECAMPHPKGEISMSLKRSGKTGISGQITLPPGLNGTFVWNGKTLPVRSGTNPINQP